MCRKVVALTFENDILHRENYRSVLHPWNYYLAIIMSNNVTPAARLTTRIATTCSFILNLTHVCLSLCLLYYILHTLQSYVAPIYNIHYAMYNLTSVFCVIRLMKNFITINITIMTCRHI